VLARAAAGDRVAFEALVRRWERPLFRFLERMLGCPHLAEEARQTTFVRVLERGASFRGGSASNWIFRVAFRAAVDLRRRERLRRAAPFEEDSGFAADSPAPDETAAREDERERVRGALAAMTEEDRAILWMRIADDRTFADIAATLSIPESTVRLRLVRALGRMRRRLRTSGFGGDRCGATRS